MRKACSFHASFHGSNDCLFFVRIERRVANEGTERFDILRWWWVDSRSCIVISLDGNRCVGDFRLEEFEVKRT